MAAGARTFAVIGLGTFGKTVASDLTRFGNHVLGIDIADGPVAELADLLRETVIADARDDKALKEAGAGQCETALVAIGDDLEANIVSVMNLKMIGVETIWAKAMSRTHHRILSRLDIDHVIHPEQEMGQRVAQMLHNSQVRDYASLGNGFYGVVFVVPEELDGKALSTLDLEDGFSLKCLEIMRGGESVSLAGKDPELKADDRMIVLGRRKALRDFSFSL